MKQTNLEIIRQACIKANPEIIELKFGCQIIHNNTGKIITITNFDEKEPYYGFSFVDGGIVPLFASGENKKELIIIGRPIRLSDIIFTLYKNKKAQYFGGMLDNNSIYFANRISWDLLHDDLNLQSEPTKKFIANLLKKKK